MAALILSGLTAGIAGAAIATSEHDGVVAHQSSSALRMRVTPSSRTVAPGARARYTASIAYRGAEHVRLRVLSGLPRGAIATFGPRRFGRATVTIASRTARIGWYRLVVLAVAGKTHAKTRIMLVIRRRALTQPTTFTIAGGPTASLSPGATAPMDLALTNSGGSTITVSGLSVSVGVVAGPQASESLPCTIDDFSIGQFSGAYGFTLPPKSTTTLSGLGIPPEQWPTVTMLNRPVDQDGCKGATLPFTFGGTASAS